MQIRDEVYRIIDDNAGNTYRIKKGPLSRLKDTVFSLGLLAALGYGGYTCLDSNYLHHKPTYNPHGEQITLVSVQEDFTLDGNPDIFKAQPAPDGGIDCILGIADDHGSVTKENALLAYHIYPEESLVGIVSWKGVEQAGKGRVSSGDSKSVDENIVREVYRNVHMNTPYACIFTISKGESLFGKDGAVMNAIVIPIRFTAERKAYYDEAGRAALVEAFPEEANIDLMVKNPYWEKGR